MINNEFVIFVSFIATIVLTTAGSIWSLTWWLSNRFTEIKELVYRQSNLTEKSIVAKLEYHEKHDDERFSELAQNIWEIRLRNAANDKLKLEEELKK